ncbi:MAG: signal peptidase II [Pseudomonadota bacterium]
MLRKLIYLPFILGLILLDQVSKWWIIEMTLRPQLFEAGGASLPFGTWLTTHGQDLFPPASLPIYSFFNIVMVWNKGVSFGMFSSAHDIMPYILSGFAVLMVSVLLVWLVRATYFVTTIPLTLVISGALANVWDRVRFGAVADFLDFHVGDWHYPAFNIADCCIVVGVAGLALDGLLFEPRRRQKGQEGELLAS